MISIPCITKGHKSIQSVGGDIVFNICISSSDAL